jgi:hypothetical protein
MGKKARIIDDTKIVVVKKENPFEQGTDRAKRAGAVLSSNGKTYADAKKKGADSWAVRQLVEMKLVKVAAPSK